MPNSETIPSGSYITEAMITNYIALNPTATRSAAIAALHNIETGVTAPTATQRGNGVLSPLISAYDSNVAAQGEGGRIISPASENDVQIAGPSSTGKWTPLGTLLATIGTIAAMVVTTLTVTTLTATNQSSTNSTSTTAYVQNFESPTVPHILTLSFTNATNTPAAILNSDATGTRTVLAIWLEQSTSTSGGTVAYLVGTSTTMFGTSTSPFINASLARVATGNELITTTSTVMTAYGPWYPTEAITVKSAVTSVHSGVLNILWR